MSRKTLPAITHLQFLVLGSLLASERPGRDQTVKERRYRMQPAGSKAWAEAGAFYESVALAAARQRWSNA